jgi:regulator of protease activity HflC (stomatin/prohibitin superfamily)
MAFKIKLKQSKTRRPRGLHALVDRAETAERQTAEMRRALAETEREGEILRAEKDRAAAHLARCIGEHERVEAESELTFYDVQTETEKVAKLDAENVAAMDHVGGLLGALHADLDSIERDLDEFIKKGGE